MSPIKELALKEPLVDYFDIQQVKTDATPILTLDLYTCTVADLAYSVPFTIDVRTSEHLHALVSWFDIDFTACHTPTSFSTGPHSTKTHWKQTIFYLRENMTAARGDQIKGLLESKPNEHNRRDLDIKISYKLETGPKGVPAEGHLEFQMR
jgi:protein arginine N-methyltransferase 1